MIPIQRRQVDTAGAGDSRAASPHFVRGRTLDDVPHLLAQRYRLRYEVYCLERQFLPAAQYPTRLESGEFDSHGLHVGAHETEFHRGTLDCWRSADWWSAETTAGV